MPHGRAYDSIVDTVFNTPMVKLQRVVPEDHASVYMKLEFFNPMASVKDRIAEAMIAPPRRPASSIPTRTSSKPTSGNTGIALAFVCACRGYPPDADHAGIDEPGAAGAAAALGAELVLTPAADGMPGAVGEGGGARGRRQRLDAAAVRQPGESRRARTDDRAGDLGDTDGDVDIFVAGVGTGGTITGVTRAIRGEA
jgi:cysteine synthase A